MQHEIVTFYEQCFGIGQSGIGTLPYHFRVAFELHGYQVLLNEIAKVKEQNVLNFEDLNKFENLIKERWGKSSANV